MPDIHDLLDTFTPEQNKAALQVLDALTRPLSVREIESQLRRRGVPRSRAVITAASLKHLAIIAMIGPEQ